MSKKIRLVVVVAANGQGFVSVWEFEKLMMNNLLKMNRITNVEDIGSSPNSTKPLVMGSTVFNEDCMTVMARYPDKHFDLAIVDPPYGIGFDGHDQIIGKKGSDKGFSNKKLYNIKEWDKDRPTIEYFTELKRVSKNQIIWGGNYFADLLQATKGWIYWDKKPNGENLTFSDGELAWTSFNKPLKAFSYGWIGFGMLNSGEKKIHPTQKPVALYEMVLHKYSKPNDLILDTHVGSGSSRIACHKNGLGFVGCEIDAEYFAAQEARFKEFTSQLRLFG